MGNIFESANIQLGLVLKAKNRYAVKKTSCLPRETQLSGKLEERHSEVTKAQRPKVFLKEEEKIRKKYAYFQNIWDFEPGNLFPTTYLINALLWIPMKEGF